ncbi:virulence factor SrfB [Geminicoccus roseus]|uniref:virulence factor SrfB n=1 Tax=Geminicoccus roseus TaxID=404900 RepID=UPI0004190B40|nr:virulence factor SrfB [Geminicoccus roseus]
MLKTLVQFPEVTSLVMNTGIQFLDFGLDEARVARLTGHFWAEPPGSGADADSARFVLHPLFEGKDGSWRYAADGAADGIPAPEEGLYEYRAARALDVFDGTWLPVPFLRQKEQAGPGGPGYDNGPTNWARVHVRRQDAPDRDGHTHRVVLAFDTVLLDRSATGPYAAPEPNDAVDDARFAFVADGVKNRWFLALDWVRSWIADAYLAGRSRDRKRPLQLEDLAEPGEYWAAYLVLLQALEEALRLPVLRFVDTLTDSLRNEPIDVDLVVDVGNSRTCGIIIEQPKDRGVVDIGQAYRLELRDLSRPERVYADPFASRIEFAPASFGRTDLSRRTGRRRDAFWWPSPVRIGPEAEWLASFSDGTEGVSGLSSAKRYLWDDAPRPLPWVNSRGPLPKSQRVPPISGPMTARLTESGELAVQGQVGMQPLYSRSSLYTLMIAELLIHALCQINAVAVREQRAHAGLPRRLRSLILTMPSATPLAEQRIMRKRIMAAIELVWQTMGWSAEDGLHRRPDVMLDWDEATATHLVWLFNEISYKFRGNAFDLFGLIGHDQPDGRTLRIASMDMGGGTTDLMIVEYKIRHGNEQTIEPAQLFREGFRQAGDDIVQAVIEQVVLPDLAHALGRAGVARPHHVLSDLFGGNRVGQTQQEQALRALLVNQLLVPVALALIAAYEQSDPRRPAPPVHRRCLDLLGQDRLSPPVRQHLLRAAEQAGARGFDLDEIEFTIDAALMGGAVHSVAVGMVEDLCDVIRAYDCDVLLLTGRPSRMPAVRDLVYANLPLSPDRVVPMDRYEVGGWYPFRSLDFLIQDPKTTAAVGALLCRICEGMTRGFVFRASRLKMRSTARFIGAMDLDGRIVARNVLLADADLDTGENVESFTLTMGGPVLLGFRQLPLERWKTTPLYYVYFTDPAGLARLATPLKLTFERIERADATLEDFRLAEVVDAEDRSRRDKVGFRLQTIPMDQEATGGYWLDTGVLRTLGLGAS